MAMGRGGGNVKTKLGMLIFGAQGTWKSSKCLELLKFKREDGKPFRVLYIDAESGSIDSYLQDYEDQGINLSNIYIIYTQSLSEVKSFVKRAKDNEDFYLFDENGNETDEVYLDSDGEPFRPDAIVVDGVTVLYIAKQQGILEFSKKRATVKASKAELTGMAKEVAIDGASIEIKDYQTLKFDGQDLILDLLACGKHFVVTCREEPEKESFKDKDGSIKSMATGNMIPSGFKDIRYNVKTVLHLFKDKDDGVIKGIVEGKDRTLVHTQDKVLIEPSLLDWQAVIKNNAGKADFTVKNTLNSSVEHERESYEKSNAKYDNELESSSNQTTNGDLTTVEDYHTAIGNTIKKLKSTAKATKLEEITNAGLPKAYMKLTDIEKLKTYLNILTS